MSKFLPLNLFIRQALLYPLDAPFLPPVDKVEKDHEYAAGRLIGTLEAAPPQGIPKTGQTDSYRTGDDGDLQIGYPLTGPRFTDMGDGTIKDNATGLMWIKDPSTSPGSPWNASKVWNDAIDNCLALTYAGHNDWRLPNAAEILSVVDYSEVNPAIDGTFFPNTYAGHYYWTSTTYKGDTDKAWAWFAYHGYNYFQEKTSVRRVKPVRTI